jgi:hypothetical protein
MESDTPDKQKKALTTQIFEEHAKLRELMEQIWLLSGPELQKASRMVVRHAASVRGLAVSGEDPYHHEYPSPPSERFSQSILAFYKAARSELRVSKPGDIAPRDPPKGGY